MIALYAAALLGALSTGAVASSQALSDETLPSYHYGAPIHVECMNRSSYVSLRIACARFVRLLTANLLAKPANTSKTPTTS